jgi:ferredoxin-NADP reductase
MSVSEQDAPAFSDLPFPMVVAAIDEVARGCRAVTLRPIDYRLLPAAEAGAHIGVHLPNGVQRQYSLFAADAAPKEYRIGVKRDAASRGGSAYIFDYLKPGDHVQIDPPRNNFPLDTSARHSVLIAGGIGITPIRAMISALEALGRRWTLYFAARTRVEAAFADELSRYPQAHFHFDVEQGAVLPIAEIVVGAPEGAHLYCCGPAPMLAAFEAATASIDSSRVHVEYFTPRHKASLEGQFVVELAQSGIEVPVAPGQSILEAIREAGVDVASSCEEGVCGACETHVLAGIPDHRDAILSERERAANKTMFICCSGCKGDRLVLDR